MNANQITTKLIPLVEIRIDGGTQIRCQLNEATVNEYAERMADGDKFPNLHVFCDGTNYWLADGFHRYHAMRQNGDVEVRCEVHVGMSTDARRFALSANGANGLRMTNEDKKKAVQWALELYPNKSSRELAKICYVSHPFVESVRSQVETVTTCEREGADGKTYKMPVKQAKQVVGSVENQVATPQVQNEPSQPSQPAATKGVDMEKVHKIAETERDEFFANDFDSLAEGAIKDANDVQLKLAIEACEKALKDMWDESKKRKAAKVIV